jgi:glucosamine 6-phosphate synthetase-like amidotransferase/phosphosugar isomerase protein
MCNLAGYIGPERAAPILLKMIEAQEGFGGGYYTGIATVHEGVLHSRKVVGATDELLKQTNALELPGSIGIIHSRSKESGDIEWGHPFINPEKNMAFVLNGHEGKFYENKENAREIIRELCALGYTFRTRVPTSVPQMFQFDNGDSVHKSEVKCLLIDSIRKKSGSWNEALAKAVSRYPAEIVGLMLCAETPECIHVARFNQPLMIGRTVNTTLLSTSALVFPEKLDSITPAPIRSVMEFTANSFTVKSLEDQGVRIADIFPMAEGYSRIEASLSKEIGSSFTDFKNATHSLWPENMPPQKDMMVYEIMRLMRQQGKIRFEDCAVEGMKENLTAPLKSMFSVNPDLGEKNVS